MNNNQLTETKNNHLSVTYNLPNGDVMTLDADTVRNFLTNGNATISDKEIAMYVNLCKAQRLNPFLKDAYLIKYSDKTPASIIVSKEAFMKRAEESPNYEGLEAGIIVALPNGKFIEREGTFKLANEEIIGGWARVYKKGKKPSYVSVSYEEYAQKDNNGNINSMWRSKKATMIRKVAIVQAMREAFPERLSGMYTEDEIDRNIENADTSTVEQSKTAYDLSDMNEINEEATVVSTYNEENTFEEYDNNDSSEEYKYVDNDYEDYIESIAERETEEDFLEEKNEEPEENLEVPYSEYLQMKKQGTHKMVQGSYNAAKKTCRVQKI